MNVKESDATLILHDGSLSPGTQFTEELALSGGKACLVANVHHPQLVRSVRLWLQRTAPDILNVAGPRESESDGIYELARAALNEILA